MLNTVEEEICCYCCLVTKLGPTIVCQSPLSMGLSRQEYCGLPFPSPKVLPISETEPMSPALAGGFFTSEPPREALLKYNLHTIKFNLLNCPIQ